MAYPLERVIFTAKQTLFRLKSITDQATTALQDPEKQSTFLAAVPVANELYASFEKVNLQTLPDESDAAKVTELFELCGKIDQLVVQIEAASRLLSKNADQNSPGASTPPHAATSNPGSPFLGTRSGSRESLSSSRQCNLKLPKIKIPVFEGDLAAWASWFDLFQTLIHDNETLSDIEKFQYLISSVAKEPLCSIKHLPLTSSNYFIAYESLVQRYQNERVLVSFYWNNVCSAPKAVADSPHALRTLLNTFTQNLQALQQYPKVDLWDFTLVSWALQKLDPATRKRFEIRYAGVSIPAFSELQQFISEQCRALEANELTVSQSVKSDNVSRPSVRTRSMVAKVEQESLGSTSRSTIVNCPFCKAAHQAFRCTQFLNRSPNDRKAMVRQARLCYNCLRPSHGVANCPSTSTCRSCGSKHHTTLHSEPSRSRPVTRDAPVTTSDVRSSANAHSPSAVVQRTSSMVSSFPHGKNVLLPTAVVEIRDEYGIYRPCRALIDTGSQSSFIIQPLVRRLGLSRTRSRVAVSGIGGTDPGATCGVSSCHIRSRIYPDKEFDVEAVILPHISDRLPSMPSSMTELSHIQGLVFADPQWFAPGRIDLLLGADLYPQLITGVHISPPAGVETPLALNTWLGWVLIGSTPTPKPTAVSSFFASVQFPVEDALRRFWEIEEVPSQKHLSKDEERAEQVFKDSHTRLSSGRFQVKLPFKSASPTFANTVTQADRRLASLERRLVAQPLLQELYTSFMQDYVTSGHMSLLSALPTESHYFIPHHGVFKSDNPSSGIRVVFDASANDSHGLSLNATQLVGPKLQSDIASVLLHFRSHEFVFTCDVRQMYRQILVAAEHRPFQLIRWRFSPSDPIQTYQLNTVTYGVSSSPFLAIRALLQLAADGAESHPLAAQALQSCLYVDDVTCGARSISEAVELQHQLIDLLDTGCFELRKWAANHPDLVQSFPSDQCRTSPLSFERDTDPGVKVLGLQWKAVQDVFSFEVGVINPTCSKRGILSQVARIYDPLGLLSPLSLFAKRLIQCLWLLGLDWDDRPPDDICQQWQHYQAELGGLSSISVPRFIFYSQLQTCELHAFCDSSESGYAAVIYTRTTDSTDSISTHFLIAKSKVAPVKRLSIPRLELCAAVLLSNLVAFVLKTYQHFTFDRIVAWSDSTVALHWIRSSSHKFKTFVANRISHIQERVPPECWRHVKSQDNPADPASRGLLPDALLSCSLWWAGPSWLSLPHESWPESQTITPSTPHEDLEEKKITLVTQVIRGPLDQLFEKYSSIRTIQAVVAWCFRFIHNCTHPEKVTTPLSADELHQAMVPLIKFAQREVFAAEILLLQSGRTCSKPIQKLAPFVDGEGVVRVGGRLSHSDLTYRAKHPALLPSKHRFTELLIQDVHQRYFHPGVGTTSHLLLQNYWILGGRRTVRHQLAKCQRCFRAKPTPVIPQMGDLPAPRVTQAKPFSVTGIDFAGPFSVVPRRSRGARTFKCYLALFVCFATKALHLELVSDLSTEAFLAALRRFIARRGRCSTIFSDCGTNFIGANRELIRYARLAIESEFITWHFNPPSSPHFGGLWESGVKSVKGHLSRVVGTQTLTFEELNTLVIQVEALLNSRPLCALSSDPNDMNALTPGHFLTLEPLTAPPDPDLSHLTTSRLSRWQLVQRMHQDFWSRWKNEYLHTLHQRCKWASPTHTAEVKVGSLVLLKDDNSPPLKWRLGRVTTVHPGRDHVARVATIQTASGTFKRPSHQSASPQHHSSRYQQQQPQQQPQQQQQQQQQQRRNNSGVNPALQQQQQLTKTSPEEGYIQGIPTLIPPDDAVNFSRICPPPPPPDNRPEQWELKFNSWLGWSWVRKEQKKEKKKNLCCGTEPADVPDDEVYQPRVSLLSQTYPLQTPAVPVSQQRLPQSGHPATTPPIQYPQQAPQMSLPPDQAAPHPMPEPIQSDQQYCKCPAPKIIDDCRCPVHKTEIPYQFSDESICCPCPRCGKNRSPVCCNVCQGSSNKNGFSKRPSKKLSNKCYQIDSKPSNGSCTCVCPKCGQCLSPTVKLHILKKRYQQKSERSCKLLQENFSDDSCICSSVKYSRNPSVRSAMSKGKGRRKSPLKQKASSKCCQCPEKLSEESLCCCTCNCPKCAQLHLLLESSIKTESIENNNDYEGCTCESDQSVCPNKAIMECPKTVPCVCHSIGVLTDQCGDTKATPVQDNNNNNNNSCCPCTCPNFTAPPPCYLCPMILPVQQAPTLCTNCCQPSLLNSTNSGNQQQNRPIRELVDNSTEQELRTSSFDTQTELQMEHRGTRTSSEEVELRTSVDMTQTDPLATEDKQTKTSFVTTQCVPKSTSPIQCSATPSNPCRTQVVRVCVNTAKPKQCQQQQNNDCVQPCRKLLQHVPALPRPTECLCVKRKVACACPPTYKKNNNNNNDDDRNNKINGRKTQDASQVSPNSCICLKTRGVCKCCPAATAPVTRDNNRRVEQVVNSCFLDVSKPFEDNIDLMNTGLSLFRKRQPIDVLLRNNINIAKLITNSGLILSNKKDFRALNFLSSKEKFDFLADQGSNNSYGRGFKEHSKFLTAICDVLLDNRKNKKKGFENAMGGDCGSHYLQKFLDSGSGDSEDYILSQQVQQPTKLKETVDEQVATEDSTFTINETQQQNQETVGIQTKPKKLQNIAVQIRQITAGKLVQTVPKRPQTATYKIVNNSKILGPRMGISTNKKENSSSDKAKKSRSFLTGPPEMTRTGIYCSQNKSAKGHKRDVLDSSNSQDQPQDVSNCRLKSNCSEPNAGETSQEQPRNLNRKINCFLPGKTTAHYIEVVEKLLGSVDLKSSAPHNLDDLDSVNASEEVDNCFACALSKIDSEPAKFDSDATKQMGRERMLDATTPPPFHESE